MADTGNVKPHPISNMTQIDRAFAVIWVKNPGMTFDQVMQTARAAVGGAK